MSTLKSNLTINLAPLGNADGIGRVRKREILTSAALLGLRAEDDVLVHEDPAFPDSMQQSWPAERIAEVLSSLFAQRMARKAPRLVAAAEAEAGAPDPPLVSIDAVITFDAAGVSGHPNHTSLYRGVRAWLRGLMRGREGWECPVALYALTSTNVVRKYAALLDVPLTLLLCVRGSMRVGGKTGEEGMSQRLMFLSDALQWRRAQKAMTSAHKSQMRWFRWGWIVLSRYMVVNDLKWVKI